MTNEKSPAAQAVSSEAVEAWLVEVNWCGKWRKQFPIEATEGVAKDRAGTYGQDETRVVPLVRATNAAAQASTPATPDGDDSLNICLSDLEHSSIYDNPREMVACMKAVIARIRALPIVTPATPSAGVVKDAARYQAWRAALVSEDGNFLDQVTAALPPDTISRPPTVAEFDAAIDAAMSALPPAGGTI